MSGNKAGLEVFFNLKVGEAYEGNFFLSVVSVVINISLLTTFYGYM